ncbi:MFS transporter [Sedimenticola thiotaurini]|uniref:Lysosomal dipeptide transporter MFSD1 n=1 Tax=Sedimenticola thiotaurini TaxID=1543721 RepID=A0A0F7JWU9_9GAMM|nr:MFS transporter [Sedimenticola thiotaurini]AKH20097.1 MFS transporter [Sedimenticola thiotaurini]
MNPAAFPPLRLAWTIWGLGAAPYFIGFYQRVAPGVMTTELMGDFQLNATALGNLSAFYFYSYVAMQVPTGLLADHWGPRRLLASGASIAGLGTLLFAMAPDALWANLGRLLIGGSVAVAFVGMLKLAGHWLPPKQYSLASGMALFCGVVGAVFAGVPLRLLVDTFGWRPVMLVSAVVTFLVAGAIWLLVRDDPVEKGYASHAVSHDDSTSQPGQGIMAGIRTVLSYRNTWLLHFIPGAGVGTVLTFAGLWGVPFLTTHYGLEKTSAAAICSALLVSWAVGGPVFGWASDHLGRRKPLYLAGCLVQLLGWGVLILVPDLPIWLLVSLLIVVGFFTGNMIIGFAFARESAPARLAGTASGIVNMGVMIGPMLLQPAVGWLLDRNWSGTMSDSVRIYGLEAYRNGFSLMLGWLALALLLILFTRETHCRQMA